MAEDDTKDQRQGEADQERATSDGGEQDNDAQEQGKESSQSKGRRSTKSKRSSSSDEAKSSGDGSSDGSEEDSADGADDDEQHSERGEDSKKGKSKGGKRKPPPKGMDLINRARTLFTQATGRAPEAVTGLRRDGDGWQVSMDVVELRRIPSSTDVMAEYLVELSADGEFLGYERVSRFIRSQSSSGEQG